MVGMKYGFNDNRLDILETVVPNNKNFGNNPRGIQHQILNWVYCKYMPEKYYIDPKNAVILNTPANCWVYISEEDLETIKSNNQDLEINLISKPNRDGYISYDDDKITYITDVVRNEVERIVLVEFDSKDRTYGYMLNTDACIYVSRNKYGSIKGSKLVRIPVSKINEISELSNVKLLEATFPFKFEEYPNNVRPYTRENRKR